MFVRVVEGPGVGCEIVGAAEEPAVAPSVAPSSALVVDAEFAVAVAVSTGVGVTVGRAALCCASTLPSGVCELVVLVVLWTEWPVKRLRREAERDFFLVRLRSERRCVEVGLAWSVLLIRWRRAAIESLSFCNGHKVLDGMWQAGM